MTSSWIPSRSAALAALTDFVPLAGRHYAAHRNFDCGAGKHIAVSRLSPYIRYRLLSEAEVVREVLSHHTLEEAEKYIQEVVWRTYWKGWLEQRPAVWHKYIADEKALRWRMTTDAVLEKAYLQAITGSTGIGCFDAWTEELLQTGYLHNHARMWFASIWIFTLQLPWQLGAAFFYSQLLDADPASNTLGWRWVAGLQTKGKHYLARASNIKKFSQGRFNPVGQLVEDAQPLREPDAFPLQPIVLPDLKKTPRGRVGLFLTADDLSPETTLLQQWPIAAVSSSGLEKIARDHHMSERSARFMQDCVEEAGTRVARHFSCDFTYMGVSDVDSLIDFQQFEAWVRSEGLEHIVWLRPSVGASQQVVAELRRCAESLGVEKHELMRTWDTDFFPEAKSGYFKFKQRIWPVLVENFINRGPKLIG